MYKEGDKIVCIDIDQDEYVSDESRFDIRDHLKLYETYVVKAHVKAEHMSRGIIMLKDITYTIFSDDRFISLIEFRKRKIEKLLNI